MTSEPTPRVTVRKESEDLKIPSMESAIKTGSKSYQKTQERLTQFDTIVESSKEIFKRKNEQYGDAIARTGVLGSVVEIVGLSARLEHMVLAAPDAGKNNQEAIIAVVKDLINYGIISGIMIMDGNWKPE